MIAVDLVGDIFDEMLALYDNGVGEGLTLVTFTDESGDILLLPDLVSAIGIEMSNDVIVTLNQTQYSIFLTSEPETGVVRTGFAVAAVNVDALMDAMQAWEPFMADDMGEFLDDMGGDVSTPTGAFAVAERNGVVIHYENFSDPTIAIDYAVLEDEEILIIGTSRHNMFTALDAL